MDLSQNHHYYQGIPTAQIPLAFIHDPFLSAIAIGKSSSNAWKGY